MLHTRGIKGDLNHDRRNSDGYHNDNHDSNCRHDHGDRDVRYDRQTLLNFIERMEASRYRVSKDNVQCLMASSMDIHTVNGRELDLPCYDGSYLPLTKHSDHFNKSNGLQSFGHSQ